jgi:pimeloyl-ACP methyl ester carboxylesterase
MNTILAPSLVTPKEKPASPAISVHKSVVGEMLVHHVTPTKITYPLPLVHIHGMCFDGTSMIPLASEFARRGYQSHSTTLRGYPGSKKITDIGEVSMDNHVADVRTVIGHLQAYFKYERVVLVGWSLGPIVSDALARRYPEMIERVIDLAPPPPDEPMSKGTRRRSMKWKYAKALLFNRPLYLDPEDARQMFFNTLPSNVAEKYIHDLHPESGRAAFERAYPMLSGYRMHPVPCPRLIIAARHEQTVGEWTTKRADKLGADLKIVDCCHAIPLDPNMSEAAEAADRWLSKPA